MANTRHYCNHVLLGLVATVLGTFAPAARAQPLSAIDRLSGETLSEDATTRTFDIVVSYHDVLCDDEAARDAVAEVLYQMALFVFESTNGAHRIGKVTVVDQGQLNGVADIEWSAAPVETDTTPGCDQPAALIGGIGFPGFGASPINPGERAPRKLRARGITLSDQILLSGGVCVSTTARAERAGIALAHEWGHYAYSLYDQYACQTNCDGRSGPGDAHVDDVESVPTIMNNPGQAVANTVPEWEWANFGSILDDFSLETAQGRVYQRADWFVLLLDPVADPVVPGLNIIAPRRFFPEFVLHGPTETLPFTFGPPPGRPFYDGKIGFNVNVEIDEASGIAAVDEVFEFECRSSLNKHIDILVDGNGNMVADGAGHFERARTVIAGLVQELEVGDSVGVRGLAKGSIRTFVPPTRISAGGGEIADVLAAVATMDDPESHEVTDLFRDTQLGIETLAGYITEEAPADLPLQIILTTGVQNFGTGTEADAEAASRTHRIPINMLVLGTDPDGFAAAQRLAQNTLGTARGGVVDVFEESAILAELYDTARNAVTLPGLNLNPTMGFEFIPDQTLGDLTITLEVERLDPLTSLDIQIRDGDGDRLDPLEDLTELVSVSETTLIFVRIAPQAVANGLANSTAPWSLQLNASGDAIIRDISMSAESVAAQVSMLASNVSGDRVSYPEPLMLTATVSRGDYVTGLDVAGVLVAPDGSEIPVPELNDAGEHGDAIAGDGIYSSLFSQYPANGEYEFRVQASSRPDTRFTRRAFADAALEATSYPQTLPAAFSRADAVRVTVQGLPEPNVPRDDHGDDALSATPLRADGVRIAGVIDHADDRDCFALFDIPTGEAAFVRVGGVGLGLDPELIVYTPDGLTELTRSDRTQNVAGDGVLTVGFGPDQALENAVACVQDFDPENYGGVYSISAGPTLPLDPQPGSELEVWSRQTKLSDILWTAPEFFVLSSGEAVSDFIVYYYFTSEDAHVPNLADWYTPQAVAQLQHLGGNNYRIEYDFAGFTVDGNTEAWQSQTLVGVHYQDWAPMHLDNDYSENFSDVAALTERIAVYNRAGQLIYGSVPFGLSTPSDPTCNDGIQNQGEGGVDCGGPCPMSCPCSPSTYQAETMFHSTGGSVSGGWNIWSNGFVATSHTFAAGPSSVTVAARGQSAANVWPRLVLSVGGTTLGSLFVSSTTWQNYTFNFVATGGNQEVRITFDNDYYAPPEDRNLLVDSVTISCPGSCAEGNAVDLGVPGTNVTVPVGGCIRVKDGYPSWWGTRSMKLETASGGVFPVPFTWSNTCSSSSGSATFTSDWQGNLLDVTSAACPTVIDLQGTGTGTVTLRYWAN